MSVYKYRYHFNTLAFCLFFICTTLYTFISIGLEVRLVRQRRIRILYTICKENKRVRRVRHVDILTSASLYNYKQLATIARPEPFKNYTAEGLVTYQHVIFKCPCMLTVSADALNATECVGLYIIELLKSALSRPISCFQNILHSYSRHCYLSGSCCLC